MIQNLSKVADTTKEPNLLKHRDVKNAILAQARTILRKTLCLKNEHQFPLSNAIHIQSRRILEMNKSHLNPFKLNAIHIQAGRTTKEGEVQVKQHPFAN